MLAIVSAAAIGCDKIDENNYIVYSGASGEWFDGTPVEDHSQRAFLEKYTGVRCAWCVYGVYLCVALRAGFLYIWDVRKDYDYRCGKNVAFY